MYCGHIYQLNSEPGRGRRRDQIGFASAAVELVRTWTRLPGARRGPGARRAARLDVRTWTALPDLSSPV